MTTEEVGKQWSFFHRVLSRPKWGDDLYQEYEKTPLYDEHLRWSRRNKLDPILNIKEAVWDEFRDW